MRVNPVANAGRGLIFRSQIGLIPASWFGGSQDRARDVTLVFDLARGGGQKNPKHLEKGHMMIRFVLASCALAVAIAFVPASRAVESVSSAKERHQAKAMASFNEGIALVNGNKPKEAIEPLTEAIESHQLSKESQVTAIFARGVAYAQSDDCANAIKDLDAVAAEKSGEGQYHYIRYICLEKTGDKVGASAALDKAIELSPDHIDYVRIRCVDNINAKNLAKALPDCEKSVAAKPDDWVIWLAISQASEILGQKDKALEGYRKVISLQPDNASAKEGLQRLGAK